MIRLSVVHAKSMQSKIVGLLRSSLPYPLFFQTRYGIHTFFMCYPIDVLVLNNEYKVITWKEHMKPNRIFLWNPLFSNIVELPSGMIQQKKIAKNITLRIVYTKII